MDSCNTGINASLSKSVEISFLQIFSQINPIFMLLGLAIEIIKLQTAFLIGHYFAFMILDLFFENELICNVNI